MNTGKILIAGSLYAWVECFKSGNYGLAFLATAWAIVGIITMTSKEK